MALVLEIHTDWEKKKSDDYALFQKHYNKRLCELYSLERIVIKKFIKVTLPLASIGCLCVNRKIVAFDELHVYVLTKGGKVLNKGPQDPQWDLYFLPIPCNPDTNVQQRVGIAELSEELSNKPSKEPSKEPSEEPNNDPQQSKTNPNQTKLNQTKPNQTKPNQTKPNQTKTKQNNSCNGWHCRPVE